MELKVDSKPDFTVEQTGGKGYDMAFFHYHTEYEMFFIDNGNRSIITETNIAHLSKFDVGFVSPNVFHRTSGPDYSSTIVYFSRDFLERFYTPSAVDKMLLCFKHSNLSLTPEEYMYIKKRIDKIKKEDLNDALSKIFIYLGDILMFLSAKKITSEEHVLPVTSSPKYHISNALNYINTHYSTITSLEEIADYLFISKAHLCRIFKQATSMTVAGYIITLRLKHACELLMTTKKSAAQISSECGFNSPIYFSQCFKNSFDMTPIQYRKTMKHKE